MRFKIQLAFCDNVSRPLVFENCIWVLVHEALEVCRCDSPGRVRGEAEMGLGQGDGLVACGVGRGIRKPRLLDCEYVIM